MQRDYFTWEEDFTSDQQELHGFDNEHIATVDKDGDMWVVWDPNGKELWVGCSKTEAVKFAEGLLKHERT